MARRPGEVPRKRGRPALPPEEGKRFPLNTRTTKELKERIEAAASQSGRSVAQEVERRLEQSFDREELQAKTIETNFGGRQMSAMLRMMAAAADLIADQLGKGTAMADYETFIAVQRAWKPIIERFRPKPGRHLVDAVVALQREQEALVEEEPQPPSRPLHTGLLGGLPGRTVAENQEVAAEWARYQQQADAWGTRFRDFGQRIKTEVARYQHLERIGDNIAAEQLAIKPKREK
jgi:hypothetical protein